LFGEFIVQTFIVVHRSRLKPLGNLLTPPGGRVHPGKNHWASYLQGKTKKCIWHCLFVG